jgi:hypothetical protein
MQDPKDSLNFEAYGFKASAVGRFTIVAVLIFLLGLVAFGCVFGLGQIARYFPHQQIETSSK